ncbi:MAG: elongation factor G, partial [Solirubrobacterales bacterium]|nr:elongation factor G [Solirubrobacterales bacterium]
MANTTAAPRCAALIGPYLSGKTTLLEALLHASGSTSRRGSVRDGNSVGDHSTEARARQMSTELNVANATFLGDSWTILDCPGSVELLYEAQAALLASDVAVVVVEPEVERALTITALLRFLDRHKIPHMIFINKMDNANARVRDLLAALQSVSQRPLVLRQVPLRGPDSEITGYVDLVSERAYSYRPGKPSDLIPLPDNFWDQERATRTGLIEKLADFDDALLEQLLEDVQPSKEDIYKHLTQDFQKNLIVPVFLGAATQDHGVRRLWKALRHEAPGPQETAARLGIKADGEPMAQVFKTFHLPHTGKLSVVRVWRGAIAEGNVLNGVRVAGVIRLLGAQHEKAPSAKLGEVVGLTRMEEINTGAILTPSGKAEPLAQPERPQPVYGLAIHAEKRGDDVKLTGSIGRLIEEDPSLELEQNPESREMVLWGQGDVHLQIALDRLRHRQNLAVVGQPATVPYRETIRKGAEQHSRFKRQSGGHGQFADCTIEVKALPRGSGFTFKDSVVGGAIPRNYIPAVEEGVVEALKHGPLGFQVVDLTVNLITGQF